MTNPILGTTDTDNLPSANAQCKKCGHEESAWRTCWSCGGEGGYHDCGEDTCCCLDPDEITNACSECRGNGGWNVCPVCVGDDDISLL